jgi:hypothetical protein
MPILFEVVILALAAYVTGFALGWAAWRASLRRKRR